MKTSLSRPVVLAGLTLALYAIIAVCHLRVHHWDPTTFISAGDHSVDRAGLVTPIAIMPDSDGYDGQFYYRLGLDPFTSKLTDFGITIDNGATRGARILFPLLAWAASLGQPAWLAWSLIGVNLAGLFAIAWMATALVRAQRLPAWLGLAVPLYPGFILTLVRDTTEIAATSSGLAALSLAIHKRYGWSAALLCLGVTARETTLFYMAGFGLVEAISCVRQRRWSWRLVPLAIPAMAFFGWQSFVAWHWGALSYSGTAQNLGAPFAGLSQFVATQFHQMLQFAWTSHDAKLHAYYLMMAGFCVCTVLLAGSLVVRRCVMPALAIDWALYSTLMACLTTAVLAQPWDFMRGFTDCFVISATAIVLSRRRTEGGLLGVALAGAWAGTLWYI